MQFYLLTKNKIKRLIKKTKRKFVFWGNLRNVKPFSDKFSYDRGNQSIARYYIDQFIESNKQYINGKVLEIGDNTYTSRFGNNVITSDILHLTNENEKATIIADLTKCDMIPSDIYDCIILTQTLNFIFDFQSALFNVHRILKPNGHLLVTLSGISQMSNYDDERWGDYWRFTPKSTKLIFEKHFKTNNFEIKTFGNVLSSIGFLTGLSSHELKKSELNYSDSNYPLIITVLCIK